MRAHCVSSALCAMAVLGWKSFHFSFQTVLNFMLFHFHLIFVSISNSCKQHVISFSFDFCFIVKWFEILSHFYLTSGSFSNGLKCLVTMILLNFEKFEYHVQKSLWRF